MSVQSAGAQSANGKTLWRSSLPLSLVVFQSFANIAPAAVVGIFLTGIAGISLGSMPLVVLLTFVLFFISLNANYQFSKHIVHAGGYYAYVGSAFNKSAGFFAGMFYVMNGITGGAAFGFLQFAVFAYFLFPQLSAIAFSWLPFVIVSIVFVTVITYVGIRPNLLYATVTGIAESAVLYIGAIALIILAGPSNTTSVFTPAYIGNSTNILFLAVVFNILSFVGAGSVITLSEEAKEPKKNIGRAFILVIFLGVLPIILSAYALTVTYGPKLMSSFGSQADPGYFIYLNHLGAPMAYLLAIFVMNSALSVGIAIYNATSRTLFGMAREGMLPGFFNHIHPRFRTPTRLILMMAIVDIILAFAAVSAFGLFDGFFVLATVTAVPVLLAHLLANFSLPFYSRRKGIRVTPGVLLTHYAVPLVTVVMFIIAIRYAIWPLPEWPYLIAPIAAAIWAVIVFAIVLYMRATRPHVTSNSVVNADTEI